MPELLRKKLILGSLSLTLSLVFLEITLRVFAAMGLISSGLLPHENLAYEPAVMARHVFPARAQRYQILFDTRGQRRPHTSSERWSPDRA